MARTSSARRPKSAERIDGATRNKGMMRDFSADVTLNLDALFVSQTIRLHLAGILEHRDVALRVVSAACKLIPPQPNGQPWGEFQAQVVSAVSEAFNNVVMHGYADMP